MIPVTKPYFHKKDIPLILKDIKTVLETGQLIIGPYTAKFEKKFAEYIGTKYAVAVNSCTTALEITLKYFNVKDAEVIVPTNTFIATANAVLNAGGKPVFVDIDKETLCLDLEDVLKRITPKTKGIIVVHIAGLIFPKIKELYAICKEKELFLIEDCAHAHGATIDGKKAGSLCDVGCFSFYPTKVMTTCTGGMITTNNKELVDFAQSVRLHGKGESLEYIKNFGNDWCLPETGAVLGLYQLKRLEQNLKRRNEIARKYSVGLKNVKGITLFKVPKNIRQAYYKYPLLLNEEIQKEKIVSNLEKNGISNGGSIYYPTVHLQEPYTKNFGYKEGMFPVSEQILSQVLCLPLYAQMKNTEVDYIIKTVKKILKEVKH